MTTIFTARWLLPITTPPLANGAVAVQGDQILAVGAREELPAQFPDAAVRDFGEAAILPGFVNVHSHLELTAFRGRLEEPHFQRWIASLIQLKSERLSSDDLLVSARLGCLEALRAGVTTLGDTADATAAAEALIESGLRGIVFQECFGPRVEQADESVQAIERKLNDLHEHLYVVGAQERVRLGVSPHAPYSVSDRLFAQVAELSFESALDIAIHAAESQDEMKLLSDGTGAFAESLRRRGIEFTARGCSTIQYFQQLGVLEAAPLLIHCVTVSDEDIALLKESGARVAHCPKSNAKFGHGIAPLTKLWWEGVDVGLGTDSVASNNTCDLLEEARFCALLHRAQQRDPLLFDATAMLKMITLDGARALSLEHRIGSLEAGKQADLIAVDLSAAHNSPHYDPATALLFSCSARDVVFTMVAGRVLYENRQVQSLDEREILQAAQLIQAKLARP
ncbi:MAG TPA: amidohydrolase family protein [Blastocatellia bacterium]|nr:amidohydrolase family protein [Blastocatellia bacterium]